MKTKREAIKLQEFVNAIERLKKVRQRDIRQKRAWQLEKVRQQKVRNRIRSHYYIEAFGDIVNKLGLTKYETTLYNAEGYEEFTALVQAMLRLDKDETKEYYRNLLQFLEEQTEGK
jgi:hypothetical protein